MVAPTGSFYDGHNLLQWSWPQTKTHAQKQRQTKANTDTHANKTCTRTDINAGVRSCKQEAAVNTVSKVRRDPGKRLFFVGGYLTFDAANQI